MQSILSHVHIELIHDVDMEINILGNRDLRCVLELCQKSSVQ